MFDGLFDGVFARRGLFDGLTSRDAQNALALARFFAPSLAEYLTRPAPPIADLPSTPGKVPSTDDPRLSGAIYDAVNLATGLLPVSAGAKVAMAAAPMAARVARRTALPMDEASRMARAEQMGFRTDLPLAHGSSQSFSAFDPSKAGATTGVAPAHMGVWSQVRRGPSEIADQFAEMAAAKTGGNPQVYPLLHRTDKPASIRLSGDETNHEIAATLAQAWDDGYDAVMLKNYTSPGGKKGEILIVKDPAQLRSPYAKFDPRKRDSRNLLAGVGGAAAAYQLVPADDDPFAEAR